MRDSRFLPLSVPLLAFLLASCTGAPAGNPPSSDDGGYVFTLDGQAFIPRAYSLEGTPETIRPGDVIQVNEFVLTVGEERVYRFKADSTAGRLSIAMPDGTDRLVAIRVFRADGSPERIVNPLEGLSVEATRGLRGVAIDYSEAPVADRLMRIDPEQTLVAFRADLVDLPPLPAGQRYLFADVTDCRFGWLRFGVLSGLNSLRFLYIQGLRMDFDATWIAGCPDLRYLDLSCRISNPEAIGRQARLRHLGIYGCDIRSLAWLRGMTALRSVDLEELSMGDGSSLDGLTDASYFDGLKNVSLLRVCGRACEDPVVAAALRVFIARHPLCRVVVGPTARLADCTRIRIRSGGLCHRRLSEEKTLAEVTDPCEIRDVVEHIRCDNVIGRCRCCGGPSLELYRGFELLLTLSMHHGQSLTSEYFGAGGFLLPESADYLCDWLVRKGIKGPSDELIQSRGKEKK
jgi:hypothetical protein